MAVKNKKTKQKSGAKKSAKSKGRTSSAKKDYIGAQTKKNSKGKNSKNKSGATNLSSSKGGGRSSSRNAKTTGRASTKNSKTAVNSRNSRTSVNNKSVANRNTNENREIHGEIIAIVTLVLGVFFAVAMHTELTGFIGDFIGKFFRGMFGAIGYLIPYTMIISSGMVFLKRERPFTKKHMVCMVVIFFMINLLNAERFMENFTLQNADIAMVYSMGNNLVGGGILGMYPGKLIETAIGPVGIYLFSIAGIVISVLIAADFSLADMIYNMAEKKQERKLRREELEYYIEEDYQREMISADTKPKEVQENFFAEFENLKENSKNNVAQSNNSVESTNDRNTGFISKSDMEKRLYMKEKLENNRRRHNILALMKKELFQGGHLANDNKDMSEVEILPADHGDIKMAATDNSLDKLLDRAAIDMETGEIVDNKSTEKPVLEREKQELQINIAGVDMNKKPEFNWNIDDEGTIEDEIDYANQGQYKMMTADDFKLDDEVPVVEKPHPAPTFEIPDEKMALRNLENQIASNKSGTAVCGAVASMDSESNKPIDKSSIETDASRELIKESNHTESQKTRKRSESKEERKEREKSEMEIQANVENKKDQATHYEVEYKLPDLSLLNEPPHKDKNENDVESLRNNALTLERTLKSFNVDAKVINVTKGSSVTRYEVQPAVGTKVSSIVRLSDDIALNLRAKSIRMEAPIPGKAAVGIEIENESREMVTISEMIGSDEFKKADSKLSFVVGKDIAGKTVVADLAKMPHMLIAGATGSGKSVCINTIITSILYHANPNEVKLVLIDPKMVELGNYNGIPHLLIPVVTDSNKAAAALNWAVSEMTGRYKKFAENSVREIKGYNKLMRKNGKPEEVMSQIVIVIDELADLMMVASSLVEEAICRLAQLARAAGIHLIVATQRPSVDVVTGLIKANIPSRIAFMVSSQVDSRTIIDMTGAEKLVGNGDMLFKPQNLDKPIRVQGPFISDEEVENIIQFIKAQNVEAQYDEKVIKEIKNKDKDEKSAADSEDVLMEDAIRTVIKAKQASVSMLQRRFRIGYNRAARIVDDMEMAGIVGPQDGSRPRTVLVDESYFAPPENEVTEELEKNRESLDTSAETGLED